MKVYLISLGCAKNRVDSEVIIGNLVANEKVEITFDMGSADLIIINTCAFIESAKEEAINTIFEVLDTKKKRQKVMVCGCLATRYKDEINELIPEFDRFAWAWHSMPSGHTTVTFAGLVMIGMLAPRYKPFTWTLAVIVGLSRICIGAHWFSDVILGAFIGMVVADIVKWLFMKKLAKA